MSDAQERSLTATMEDKFACPWRSSEPLGGKDLFAGTPQGVGILEASGDGRQREDIWETLG